MAKLEFKYGNMNCGKTAQLQMRAYNYDERKIPYLIIKSSIDTRDDVGVIHSRPLGNTKCLIVYPEENIYETISDFINKKGKIKYLLVDESQFLSEKQVDELSDIVDYLNVNVVCYGLRTDFKTKLFSGSKRLFEISDTIQEITSTCSCGEKNIYNARIDENGDVVTDGKQIEVGGEEKYLSMCRKCYKEKTNK